MNKPLPDNNLRQRSEELLQRFFDAELTDEEGAELLALWNEFPSLESEAQRGYRVEGPIRFFAEVKEKPIVDLEGSPQPEVTESLSDLDELVRLAAESPALPNPMMTVPSELDTPSHKPIKAASKIDDTGRLAWITFLCLTLFAVAVFCEFYPSPQNRKSRFRPIARIVESIEAEWGDENFKAGRELEPSVLKLHSGVVKLEFTNGAEVILEGPVEFLIKRKDAAFLQYGKLSAHVPPQAVGFEIASPTATVVDLGTDFSMQVGEGKSDIHVLKGKVEVRQSAFENLLLPEGLAALFQINTQPKPVAADPSTFFSDKNLQSRKERYVRQRQTVWQEQLQRQETDPALIYRLDMKQITSLSQVAGSRPDTKAVRFENARSRIPIRLDRECRHLTLLASVRLERLDRLCHAILVGDDYYTESGQFFWQFDSTGFFQFHLNDNGKIRRFNSSVAVRPQDRNTWLNIALVADADQQTITFYLDGKAISSLPWDDPKPLRIDTATIGNESGAQRRTSTRYFGGSIENFWIYDRPFSLQEIKDFYDNNY